MRFISPKIDYVFKKVFGSKESQDILISFLNAIIYVGVNPPLTPPRRGSQSDRVRMNRFDTFFLS